MEEYCSQQEELELDARLELVALGLELGHLGAEDVPRRLIDLLAIVPGVDAVVGVARQPLEARSQTDTQKLPWPKIRGWSQAVTSPTA